MATEWIAADVKCPFYRSSDRSKCEIICEACTDAWVQIMRFKNGKGVDEQLCVFCSSESMMKRCEQYKAIANLKYAGEE